MFTITVARFRGLEWRCFGGLFDVLARAFRFTVGHFEVSNGGLVGLPAGLVWRNGGLLVVSDAGGSAAMIRATGGDPTPTYLPVHSPRSEGSSVCVCVCVVCVCVTYTHCVYV